MISLRFPKLTEWQNDTLNIEKQYKNKGKTIVVKSARQRGKSFFICCLAIKRALEKDRSTVIIVSPTNTQNSRIFKQIKSSIVNTPILKSANAGSLIITLHNNSEIIFKSSEQRDRLRGYTASSCLIVDEAAFISEEVFEIIHPFVTKHKAEMFLFSTPLFQEGTFYRLFQDGLSDNENVISIDWCNEKYDYSEFITPEQIEYYRSIYAPLKFKCEIIGEFISDKSFVFGDFTKCIKLPGEIKDEIPVYAGIDWGTGIGNDSTVVTIMNSYGDVLDIWATNKMQTNEQIEHISELLNSMPTLKSVVVEMNSIGKVFYDNILAKLNKKSILKCFNMTNNNKRTVIERLITAFNNKKISIPDNKELHKQLSAFEIQKTASGYTYNNANPNIHDDYVISLALTWYACNNRTLASFGFSN